MPKVLIGINTYPGHAFCREEYVESIKAMQKHAHKRGIDSEVLVVWNGNQPQWGFDDFKVVEYKPLETDRGIDILVKKQNVILDYFMKRESFTHLFMSESDTLPVRDTLSAYIKYDKDIISQPYWVESQNYAVVTIPLDNPRYVQFAQYETDKAILQLNKVIPCVWGLFGNRSRLWDTEDLLPQRGLVRCMATGIGACLIKREVLRKVGRFRVRGKKSQFQQFTDFLFGLHAFREGFQMFADTDRIAKHLHYDFDDEQALQKWFDPNDVTDLGTEANPFDKSKDTRL